ncbi:phenylalanine--tRNA ligase beta subunit-related protein [Clostridium sardiniense]
MKFIVDRDVFNKLDNVCFGVVVAKGIDNSKDNIEINKLLKNIIELDERKFEGKKVKELEEIIYYRDAFKSLDINPNKFMASNEAMLTRIAKKKGLPNINPIVNLGNAISLKYLVPLGAHDIDTVGGDIYVKLSKKGDSFIPFGSEEKEYLEDDELIYFAGDRVRTRRWIWRQSEHGKIVSESKNIFFPIDGFTDKNYDEVISARDELAKLLEEKLNCEVKVGFIDKNNSEFEI